jgi:hypothetical protein
MLRVTDPIFQFLLFARVPTRNVLKVSVTLLICTTSWLPHSGRRHGRRAGSIDALDDGVVAVAVVERAHDFKRGLAAMGAGGLVHDEVTGVALYRALLRGFQQGYGTFPPVSAVRGSSS